MDAVPLTLGQEFSGYVAMLDSDIMRIKRARDGLLALAIGGTAVGTGLNTKVGFSELVCDLISESTGLGFIPWKTNFQHWLVMTDYWKHRVQ